MRPFLALLAKDLRLLWRDRVGLAFLTLAPLAVIIVAGLSLANLYGADPTGQTAYELPVADEDGGALGREIEQRLAGEKAVRLRRGGGGAGGEEEGGAKQGRARRGGPPGAHAAGRPGPPGHRRPA